MTLADKTLFITGATRGIGKAIALRAARDGGNLVVVGKTDRPHRILPGTVHTAAAEIEAAGGRALPLVVDIRDEVRVAEAVAQAVEHFGGIDILVNNASAILLTSTLDTPMKRYDLMHEVNARGTFVCAQACLPHLLERDAPHILTISPPLDLEPGWFGAHVAYTLSKYGMSLTSLGLAAEFGDRVAVNTLWPRTIIDTAALRILDGIDRTRARTTEIMADAAHAILTEPRSPELPNTGRFLIDEDVLRGIGIEDFTRYAVAPDQPPQLDLFVRP